VLSAPPSKSRKEIAVNGTRFLETPAPTGASRSGAPTNRLLSTVAGWLANQKARRELFRCASLDRRFAWDIGLTPDEIERECSAPFWAELPSGTYARSMGRAMADRFANLDRSVGRPRVWGRPLSLDDSSELPPRRPS